jgi:hypothetical protein
MQTGISKKEFSVPLSFQLLSDQYEVDSTAAKTQINVVLQGRSRDITTFDGTKLEAKIDARNFATGTIPVRITESMITVPSFLSVVEIDPVDIKIFVSPKNQAETDQEDKII